MQENEQVRTEEHEVEGEGLVGKIRELIHDGNVTRILIRNEEGKTLIEIPATIGVIGVLVAPVWAAIGAIAGLVTKCTLVIEKREG